MSVIGGYGTSLNTRLEDLAEIADYTPKADSDVYDQAIDAYLRALHSAAAMRSGQEVQSRETAMDKKRADRSQILEAARDARQYNKRVA